MKTTGRRLAALGLAGLLALSCGTGPRRDAVVAMEDDIITLDPYLHDDSITHSVLANIYDALVAFDRELRLVPSLAERWENPDDLTWRFHLRPGVTFHDGRPLSAADVKYSLERARRGKVGHYLSMVREVRAVDSLTVEVLTRRPYPVLLNKLTFIAIMPAGTPEPVAAPLGTGAYRFVSYRRGAGMTLEARPSHWRGRPAIERATFTVLPEDSARLRALLDGRVDLIRDLDERDLDRIKDRPEVEIISRPGLGVSLLGVNTALGGPLRNRDVRRAVFWALDPAALVAASGMSAGPINQLVSPYVMGYMSEDEYRRPDRARAAQLLRRAGYPRGLALELETSKTAADQIGAELSRQLSLVGIRLTVRGLDWPELSGRMDRRQSAFFLVGWSCSSGDASDLFDACLRTPDTLGHGSANWGGYRNPALDRLIERSGQTLDSRERIDLLHRAMRLTLEDMPLIPLYVRDRMYGRRAGLSFSPRQDGRIRLDELSWAR
ncbi:MAG: ABC transporter substrate-binding protein [Candidatus Edwardsbacteria bacterium]|jgi:peptide/nickel transport system substrate-binding protein|nr:ABC transporter substrate-binding protein [Candidatus Edwardsbacteria bacterium]